MKERNQMAISRIFKELPRIVTFIIVNEIVNVNTKTAPYKAFQDLLPDNRGNVPEHRKNPGKRKKTG